MIDNYMKTKKTLEIVNLRLELLEKNKELLNCETGNLTRFKIQLQETLDKMDINLKSLKDIEYKLYYEIVVNGLNVTKAIDKVSFDVDKDVSTIWKNYYPKIKDKIKKSDVF